MCNTIFSTIKSRNALDSLFFKYHCVHPRLLLLALTRLSINIPWNIRNNIPIYVGSGDWKSRRYRIQTYVNTSHMCIIDFHNIWPINSNFLKSTTAILEYLCNMIYSNKWGNECDGFLSYNLRKMAVCLDFIINCSTSTFSGLSWPSVGSFSILYF